VLCRRHRPEGDVTVNTGEWPVELGLFELAIASRNLSKKTEDSHQTH